MASFQLKLRREYLDNKRRLIPVSKVDYGSLVEVMYKGSDKVKKYDVFVLHPALDGKTFHCLDLSLIDEFIFEKFYLENKQTDPEILYKNIKNKKGLFKPNIRIGTSFYESKVKRDKLLMKNRPYKTLKIENIKTIKYIPYDESNIVELYKKWRITNPRKLTEELNDNESEQL